MFSDLFEKLSHLPVSAIAEDIAKNFALQSVPVVTSDVASGKTMLIPAYCALELQRYPLDQIVYVLEPTRFLANNAAESLRKILGKKSENLIGCINSNRSDDTSVLHADNRIIFTTVGYALSSGILVNKNNFILDEAHETSIDLSLTKAYLYHRKKSGDLINIAVLSATIDITNEMEYWGNDAIHFTTEGSAFPVEFLHRPAFSLVESVITLIEDHGRKGILVFVSGVEEINEAVLSISTKLLAHGIDFEIESIHGNSSSDERQKASRDRRHDVKILVGTNVLESGVSLTWVDSGVSSGDTKVMHVNGNVRKLKKEELPRWRINQQCGRVGRFEPGVFILAHPTPLDIRPDMSPPDIVRLPLTELVMHCTAFPDIHVRDLEFTSREQPKEKALDRAISTLVEYELIEHHGNGRVTLTEEGRMIQPLPLSYRAGAAYCESGRLKREAQMLPLIALLDIEDLRHDYRNPMYGSGSEQSDLLFQLNTIVQHFSNWRSIPWKEREGYAAHYNVSFKRLQEFDLLLSDLEKKTGIRSDFSMYAEGVSDDLKKEFEKAFKQVIFRAMILEVYPYSRLSAHCKIPVTEQDGSMFTSATPTNTTNYRVDYPLSEIMCAGNIRIISPKRGYPFAILESITAFTKSDVVYLSKRFGNKPLARIADLSITSELAMLLREPNEVVKRPSLFLQKTRTFGDLISSGEPIREVVNPTPTTGSFGALLSKAMSDKR